LLLGIVGYKPAIAKSYTRQPQMGNLEADISFPPPGLIGLDTTPLVPEPPLIFPVILSSYFRVFVWHHVLLSREN